MAPLNCTWDTAGTIIEKENSTREEIKLSLMTRVSKVECFMSWKQFPHSSFEEIKFGKLNKLTCCLDHQLINAVQLVGHFSRVSSLSSIKSDTNPDAEQCEAESWIIIQFLIETRDTQGWSFLVELSDFRSHARHKLIFNRRIGAVSMFPPQLAKLSINSKTFKLLENNFISGLLEREQREILIAIHCEPTTALSNSRSSHLRAHCESLRL